MIRVPTSNHWFFTAACSNTAKSMWNLAEVVLSGSAFCACLNMILFTIYPQNNQCSMIRINYSGYTGIYLFAIVTWIIG